jgi:hypothetical protein
MKKLILLSVAVILSMVYQAQNKKAMALMNEIEGQWIIGDNGQVTYSRVIDSLDLTKDEIYLRSLNYFTYHYGSGKSVIQSQDKKMGVIVGKGIYASVYKDWAATLDVGHIVRIDVKEGRARLIVTLTDYEIEISQTGKPNIHRSYVLKDAYPVNPDSKRNKTVFAKYFYHSHYHALAAMETIEKALRKGTTIENIENSEW